MASTVARLQTLRVYVLGGLVPAILGVFLLGMGTYSYLHQRHFLQSAVHARGTVVGNSSQRVSRIRQRSILHYTAIFTFADAAGKTWRVTDQSTDYTLGPRSVGQSCPVLYNPDNPAEAQLELPDALWNGVQFPLYAVAGGALFAALGLWVLRKFHARPQPPAAARDPAILSGP